MTSTLRRKISRAEQSHPYHTADWLRLRKYILHLYSNRCALCGVSGEEKQLQIAHWAQRLEWDSIFELPPLCVKCHSKHDAVERLTTRHRLKYLRKEAAGQLRFSFPRYAGCIEIQEGEDITGLVCA